jgi:iduronate 2-sulfatase
MLRSFSTTGQNFFAAPGFYKPHLPFIFPKRFLDLYADYNETAPDEVPATPAEAALSWTGWSEFRGYSDIADVITSNNIDLSTPGNYMPRAKQVEIRKAYFSAVSYNDDVIGRVLKVLEETGLDKTTVVVMFGDHGWMLNDGGDYAKHTNFESVLRAPLMIRSPLHPGSFGKQVIAFTEHIDIFPTLLELTGLNMPGADQLQGHSLVPLLENPALPALPARPYSYSQYPRHTDNCGLPPGSKCGNPHAMGYTIRTAEWRYTEWVDFDNNTYTPDFSSASKVRQVELWDHRGDVDGRKWTQYERANLAGDPQYAAVVANMSALLHAGPNLLHPKREQ